MQLDRILARLWPQPVIATATTTAALLLISSCWTVAHPGLRPGGALLIVLLFAALSLSYKYPIHIQRGTKVCMGTAALYLLATLTAPPLAAVAAAMGVIAGNWSVRSQRGLYISDILTDASCWASIVLAASLMAHAAVGPAAHPYTLAGAGLVLWIGQMLTAPLLIYPITRQNPASIVALFAREAGVTEACQYLFGFLGALVATQYVWALGLLLVPLVPLYLAFKTSKETQETTRRVLESMADAVDLRDVYTGGHSRRVAEYSAQILEAMNISGPEVDLIVTAARVHDIGKIGIPDRVLLKDGALTPEERSLMEAHPEDGARLLERYPDFTRGIEIVRHHHEAWDGSGYPARMRDTDIPFGARILAVADSYDAMTSDRPYRAGMPREKAMAILREGRGRQWEAGIVDAFLAALTDGESSPVPVAHGVMPGFATA